MALLYGRAGRLTAKNGDYRPRQVTTDEICAAVKDGFTDTRVLLEPAGALAIAGAKKFIGLGLPAHPPARPLARPGR